MNDLLIDFGGRRREIPRRGLNASLAPYGANIGGKKALRGSDTCLSFFRARAAKALKYWRNRAEITDWDQE
jgi:hypothetical protein